MPIVSNGFSAYTDNEAAKRKALKAMGMACFQVAKPLCPVGNYPGTGKVGGNLKNSHRVKIYADHVDVGVTADYGGYVHNGTSKQKAQPWLKDAAEANRNSILQFGIDTLAREMGQ
jgi:HK97 gp10 family phage protein